MAGRRKSARFFVAVTLPIVRTVRVNYEKANKKAIRTVFGLLFAFCSHNIHSSKPFGCYRSSAR